jgi:glycosyltransferase involved in cell wall biosynthesis
MSEIRLALTKLWRWNQNFINVVRMSSSPPLIFKDFPCDFYMTPSEELKTFLYGTADILVYASYYDSCPRPPLEAMAAGVAVICTDTGGAREYCVDGENCILVKSKSVDEIFSALKLLIESDDIREHIVHGGFRTASQRSQEREWLELEDLLQNLV